MIRVQKLAGPKILVDDSSRGPKETQKLKDLFDAGNTDFEFESSIYGAKSVKKALIKAQLGKCVFCESRFDHVSYGDVEHFRPKGGWVQADGNPLRKPGYYWLAYDWDNLFASCEICNQRFKKNYFPLSDVNTRALSHHDDVADERALLPHPEHDNPEDYITYNSDGIPVPTSTNDPRSVAMIDTFGLDRFELVERRKEMLEPIMQLKEVFQFFSDLQAAGTLSAEGLEKLASISAYFQEITQPDSEYSVLKKAFLVGVV